MCPLEFAYAHKFCHYSPRLPAAPTQGNRNNLFNLAFNKNVNALPPKLPYLHAFTVGTSISLFLTALAYVFFPRLILGLLLSLLQS
jgi:hypothetical protein